jgi:hypothetical protein
MYVNEAASDPVVSADETHRRVTRSSRCSKAPMWTASIREKYSS